MQNNNAFNPDMLVLARQSRGYSQTELAQLLSITSGWLSKVEAGIKEITPDKIEQIAMILDYPVSFFYRRARLYGSGISELFHRSRSKVPVKARDKNEAKSNIYLMNLESLLNGVDIGDIEIPKYDLHEFDGDIQDIARTVRAKWQLPRGPIRNVVKTIEEARGIVIPVHFESKLIDATSQCPPNMPPIFFMETDFPSDRIRFSLCHELGHIVMHQDSPNPFQEKEAQKFAAEFLMPEDDIKASLYDLNLPKLASLKPYWKVSMAALLNRAKDLNTITERHAKTLWIELGKAGYRMREPMALDIPREEPKLLQEIIGTYCNYMGYSMSDLAKLFDLHEHEVCSLYFNQLISDRDKDVRYAIKAAEDILKEYK